MSERVNVDTLEVTEPRLGSPVAKARTRPAAKSLFDGPIVRRAVVDSFRKLAPGLMVRNPVIATPDMEVNDLRRTMLESSARYLPVMQDSKLIGVISFRDVAKAVLEEQDFENKMLKGYIKNWPE